MANNHTEALKKLFEFERIERIICVDDRYREFPDDLINDIIGHIAPDEKIQTRITHNIEELGDLIWEDDDQWRSQLKKIWSDADKVKRKSLYDKFIPLIPDYTEEESDVRYSRALKELLTPLSGSLELKELSFSQWKLTYGLNGESITDDELKKKGTLFLFDQDLSNENESGGTVDGGIKIIKNLLDRPGKIPIMCGLYSRTFLPNEEYSKWIDLSEAHHIDKDRFVLISKQNLTGDRSGFVRRLRLPILNKYCNDLKKQASDILDKSFEESNKEINKLNVYDFEKIVFHSSYAEGIWETDTLFRLHNIYHKHSIYQKIIDTRDIFDTANKIREISKIEIGKIDEDFSELWKIQRLEYYEDGEQINRMHRPIELGDIFLKTQSSSQKKFILLAQPCNLMVRTSEDLKGKRAYNLNEAVLAEILDTPPLSNDFCYELEYFDEQTGKTRYVDISKTYSVLLCILDLCVFNKSGVASMSSEDVCPSEIIPAWEYRFKRLKDKFDEIIKECNEFKGKGFEEKFFKKYLLPKSSHDGNGLFKPKIYLTINGKESITYDCQRIKRLCKRKSEDVLSKYANYISRTAFEHTFDKSLKDGATKNEKLQKKIKSAIAKMDEMELETTFKCIEEIKNKKS